MWSSLAKHDLQSHELENFLLFLWSLEHRLHIVEILKLNVKVAGEIHD